jgi:hypothetical protein
MAGAVYATIEDIQTLIRDLTAAEQQKALNLLPIASARLRIAANKHGADIDDLIADNSDYEYAVREIVCKAVVRALDSTAQSNTPSVVSQESQSALGYVASMTYLNAGQSLYFLKNELKDLGLMRQFCGTLDIYGVEGSQ